MVGRPVSAVPEGRDSEARETPRGTPAPRRHSPGLEQLRLGHALQPVREQLEGAALRQQHEQAVEGLDQVRVVPHVQELQAQICGRAEARGQGSAFPPPTASGASAVPATSGLFPAARLS